MKNQQLKKWTSRKFLVSAIAALAGLVTLIVGENEAVDIVAGALMTVLPAVVYCLVEGKLDAASIQAVTDATADAAEKLGAGDEVVDTIGKFGELTEVLAEATSEETASVERQSRE